MIDIHQLDSKSMRITLVSSGRLSLDAGYFLQKAVRIELKRKF